MLKPRPSESTVRSIVGAVARVLDVDPALAYSRDLSHAACELRHLSAWAITQETGASHRFIARQLGRHHSTIRHSLTVVAGYIEVMPAFADMTRRIEQEVRSTDENA